MGSDTEDVYEVPLSKVTNDDLLSFMKDMKKDFGGRISKIEEQNNKFLGYIKKLRSDVDEVTKKNENLSSELKVVKKEFNQLKQKSLENDMIVTGLPDKVNENLVEVVNSALNRFGIKVKNSEINHIYRLRNKTGFSPILVEFATKSTKVQIMEKQKANGSVLLQMIDNTVPESVKKKVLFKNRLTPENINLLKVAHEFKNTHKFKYAWFNGDSVCLKKEDQGKPIKITCDADFVGLN